MEEKEVQDLEQRGEQASGRKHRGEGSPAWLSALIIGLCVFLSASALAFGLYKFKSGRNNTISATGSASVDFESDLVVWSAYFSVRSYDAKQGYSEIEEQTNKVREYLEKRGVADSEVVFEAVNISMLTKNSYDEYGNYIGSVRDGYELTQYFTVTSSDLDKVERISRDISVLISEGIEVRSNDPQYYYTKLDDLKLSLIRDASANARERIEIILRTAGASSGKLVDSSLGVFQITARNSGTSSYAYDGAFDTSSRYKTATVTVRLSYELK